MVYADLFVLCSFSHASLSRVQRSSTSLTAGSSWRRRRTLRASTARLRWCRSAATQPPRRPAPAAAKPSLELLSITPCSHFCSLVPLYVVLPLLVLSLHRSSAWLGRIFHVPYTSRPSIFRFGLALASSVSFRHHPRPNVCASQPRSSSFHDSSSSSFSTTIRSESDSGRSARTHQPTITIIATTSFMFFFCLWFVFVYITN